MRTEKRSISYEFGSFASIVLEGSEVRLGNRNVGIGFLCRVSMIEEELVKIRSASIDSWVGISGVQYSPPASQCSVSARIARDGETEVKIKLSGIEIAISSRQDNGNESTLSRFRSCVELLRVDIDKANELSAKSHGDDE